MACQACQERLTYIREPFCTKCGKPLEGMKDREYCDSCQKRAHSFDRGRALLCYDDCVRQSIAAFKYHGRREYREFYAREMAKGFYELALRWQPEALIPIPLHASRKRKRGYNQAELVARELGRLWGVPVDTGLLRRRKKTLPQKQLNERQRRENLKAAFFILADKVKYKTVILIDDIYTTGSTMDAAARILKEKGVRKVYFLCISIGSGR